MRVLTEQEKEHAAALAAIPHVAVGLFEVTETQLKKSIIDANASIRRALRAVDLHNFHEQEQGPDHKVILPLARFESGIPVQSNVSLYRPLTKDGDPRFWPYGAAGALTVGSVGALICTDDELYLVQLDDTHFDDVVGFLAEDLAYEGMISPVARELLEKLRVIAAAGEIASPRVGDTAVGAALEAALGIRQNSYRAPDFKGIELKSKRRFAKVRSSLFACVPDWDLSACKSSRDIVERHGYQRDGNLRLYCQVNAGRTNSQGLQLVVDHERGLLEEVHRGVGRIQPVATWRLDRLERRLAAKHAETFWVTASSSRRGGREWFQLHSVEHTRTPRTAALAYLIDDDIVSMDHLIKRKEGGAVSEKGPLFKMHRADFCSLFPQVLEHRLT